MMTRHAGTIALCLGLTVLGMAGGWVAARQAQSKVGRSGHGHAHGETESRPGTGTPALSPQALRNLGITLAPIEETVFVKYQSVPAVIEDAPTAAQPLYAPIGGRVTEIRFAPASLVPAGAPIVAVTLDRTVEVRAPEIPDVPDWDLEVLAARLGQKIEAGQVLGVLRNPRRLMLRSEPVGGEISGILSALGRESRLLALPLVAGAGPVLEGLRISHITSDAEGHGEVAYLPVENAPLHVVGEGTGRTRTWQLRPGQRYMLRVPAETMEAVYVVPSGAVTDDGPDTVVFLEDGESFKAAKVVVRYWDDETAVLDARHSDLFPGDAVVQNNAFALGLALKAGAPAADPHAGHTH